ncbi:MAG: CDP-alcohol phosphatidyltransferase family protein [Phycisphaerae bacterium]|nr:CDP-alcohol phosphatidyltransferase family protein [Phycisphaerae bacterium]
MKLSWANRITILRILLIVPFISCMLKINYAEFGNVMRYIAIVIFLFMAISDVVDGYMARRSRQITRLGAFLDPVADKLLITSACLLLISKQGGVKGFPLPSLVVVLIISKDVVLTLGFVTLYFFTSKIYVAPIFVGKVATTLQLSMVAGILLGPEFSSFLPGWIWFLKVLWWSAAGTAVLALIIYIRNGVRYYEEYEHDVGQEK